MFCFWRVPCASATARGTAGGSGTRTLCGALGALLCVEPPAARPAAGAQSAPAPAIANPSERGAPAQRSGDERTGRGEEGRDRTQGTGARGAPGRGHPPPARPPPARCGAAGMSAGVWSPGRGSPRSLGAGWRRCGSSGRSCPCGGPACCPGPCTSAHASGCWTARSGSLRAARARLSVPGTRRGERPGRSHARDARPCRWLTAPRSGASARRRAPEAPSTHCGARGEGRSPDSSGSVRPGGRRAVGQATRPTASHGGKEMQQGGGLHPAEGMESPERTQVHSE